MFFDRWLRLLLYQVSSNRARDPNAKDQMKHAHDDSAEYHRPLLVASSQSVAEPALLLSYCCCGRPTSAYLIRTGGHRVGLLSSTPTPVPRLDFNRSLTGLSTPFTRRRCCVKLETALFCCLLSLTHSPLLTRFKEKGESQSSLLVATADSNPVHSRPTSCTHFSSKFVPHLVLAGLSYVFRERSIDAGKKKRQFLTRHMIYYSYRSI